VPPRARVAHTTLASRSTPFRASCSRSLCEKTTARGSRIPVAPAARRTCRATHAELVPAVAVAGYFPVRLEALPEGTVVHANCPVYQVQLRAQQNPHEGTFSARMCVGGAPCSRAIARRRSLRRASTRACARSWKPC
jgi:hypothetical protein